MKKMNNSFLFLTASILLSTAAHATQAPPTQYDDVVENYLAPGKGSTVSALTNLSNNSRWYGTYRLKAGYLNYDSTNAGYLQLNGRLRGKTYFAEKTAIIGDFWLKGQENYVQNGRNNTNGFDDFDEKVSWEQFRFGISHDDLGALMYGKHTATWSLFTVDMGSQGLFDTQGDAGLKNAGKFLYKKQFPNNLFLSGSWDYDSHIYGIDVGYQTADIYSYKPNDYGLYVSMHNGQPSVVVGNKPILGNVNINRKNTGGDRNSDSPFSRDSTTLNTYALSGYGNISGQYRVVGQTAYSKRDDSETTEQIRDRGWAKGGLGFSATAGVQKFPEKLSGFSYILYNTWEEIGGASITPQVEYWFGSPNLRAWLSYTWEEKSNDTTRVELQWDF